MADKNEHFQTRLLHPELPEKLEGHPVKSHTYPIFQTSTYIFDSTQEGADIFSHKKDGHAYSRMGNPTVEYFEEMVKEAEGAAGTAAFGAGMGAIYTSIFAFIHTGDHIIAGDTLYGCTVTLLNKWAKQLGIEVDFVDTSKKEEVAKHIKKNTKIVYLESPANPSNKVSDIRGICEIAHKHEGIKVIVDATFSSPYFLRPLELGADISLHSVTKYINGHGDVVGGVSSAKASADIAQIKLYRDSAASLMSPMDAFLCARGMKTLPMRMKVHMENGIKVAEFLEKHPKVAKVNHPWLDSFEGSKLAKSEMHGCGSTFSFEMKSFEAAKKLMEGVKLCSLAVSLGCLDTLIEHPASMTHAAVPKELMKEQGVSPELVRISVGVENVDDIIADLKQALEQC